MALSMRMLTMTIMIVLMMVIMVLMMMMMVLVMLVVTLIMTANDGTIINPLQCNVLQISSGMSQCHKAMQGKERHM